MNLARFVSSVSGRLGSSREIHGGTVVACMVPVKNGYLDAAIPTNYSADPAQSLDEAQSFFSERQRPFVVWVPQSFEALKVEIESRGVSADFVGTPAMSIATKVDVVDQFNVQPVVSTSDRSTFAEVCERGYEIPGLGWLLHHIEAFDADGTTWVTAFDDAVPVGVACGFHDGTTGGIYYVATPPEHRGRGVGRAVTAWLVNDLLERGVSEVILQSSKAGLSVYERLGFTTYDLYDRYILDPGS